jgi:hypothetical protein
MSVSQLSITGLLGATVTVAATTLDDAIWLVPFVGSSSSPWSSSARVAHAVVFVLTLVSLAIASIVVALLIQSTVTPYSDSNTIDEALSSSKQQEILLGSIAAVLCWVLAFAFFVKKLLKRRRRRQQQLEQEEKSQLMQTEEVGESTTRPDYQATNLAASNSDNLEDGTPTDNSPSRSSTSTFGNIGTVISLTALGALDEVSYFPALIMGKIFTPLELCLGTMLAACIILNIVTCCLARCKPLVDCLDHIPIYAVIAMFATILTIGVLYDAFWDQN